MNEDRNLFWRIDPEGVTLTVYFILDMKRNIQDVLLAWLDGGGALA